MDDRDRFTRWYDKQSFDTLVLIGLIPMGLLAIVVTLLGVFGG